MVHIASRLQEDKKQIKNVLLEMKNLPRVTRKNVEMFVVLMSAIVHDFKMTQIGEHDSVLNDIIKKYDDNGQHLVHILAAQTDGDIASFKVNEDIEIIVHRSTFLFEAMQ